MLEEIKLTSKKELGLNLTNPTDKNQRQTVIDILSKYEDEFKDNIKYNATVCFEKDTETQRFDLKVGGFINFLHECQNIILEECPEILKGRSLNIAQVQGIRPRNNGHVSLDIEAGIPKIKQRISELKYKPLKAPPVKLRKKDAVMMV